MYSRQPRTWRTKPSALGSGTSPLWYADSASRTTSSGWSTPRFIGTDSRECAIAQSWVNIASSGGPKCGNRCSTKWASARLASPAVTANQRGPSRPTVGRSIASRSSRTPSSIPSSGGCHGPGTSSTETPFGGGSRLSWS